jgi:hypothetical protein
MRSRYYHVITLVRQGGRTWTPFENLSNGRTHRQQGKSVVLNLLFENGAELFVFLFGRGVLCTNNCLLLCWYERAAW